MTTATGIDAPTDAQALLESWDRQQTAFIRYRDQRFASIVSMVRRVCGAAPRVLDLACGPGSMSRAVRDALPEARIVACDKDPLLLAIARDVFAGDEKMEILEIDLDDAGQVLALPGVFDAAMSSTALHWLHPPALAALYYALADKIRQGGVFMNGDHLYYDEIAQPSFRRIASEDDADQQETHFAAGVDTWEDWWAKATACARYAEAAAARETVWEGKNNPTPKVTLGYHLETLRSAGFAETGTIWQYLDDVVVCAIR